MALGAATSYRRSALGNHEGSDRAASSTLPALQVDLSGDLRARRSGYPDGPVQILVDPDPAAPAERGALADDIGRRRQVRAEQPLGQRRVQASGDRIFDRLPVHGEERPYLEFTLRARRVRPGDSDVEIAGHAPDVEHGLRAGEQDGDPAWPVICPLRVDDVRAGNA